MNILYINLKSRPDRKRHVERELAKLNKAIFTKWYKYEAQKAKRDEHKALGCILSHIACLHIAEKENWPMVLICEDDITFTNVTLFEEQLSKFMKSGITWDVILIAGNNFQPYTIIDDTCIRVNACQTTTGYIIKREYYTTLIRNFEESYALLKEYKNEYNKYAMDKWWFKLQEVDKWYLIVPLSIIQYKNYSDILCRTTDYSEDMKMLH